MSSRLPTPGSDYDDWGSILNDFLAVEHNSDGTLKIRTDGTIPTHLSQLTDVNASTPSDNQVLAYSSSSSAWVPATSTSSVVTDATTSTKGIVQLSGDLGGVASSPTLMNTANVQGIVAAVAPVTSVAGRTGAITLAEGDVTNLAADLGNKLSLSGGTLTGPLVLAADPTSSLDAATKEYVDNVSPPVAVAQGSYLTSAQGLLAGSYYNWLKTYNAPNNGYIQDQENQSPLGTYNATDLGHVYLSAMTAIVAINVGDTAFAVKVLDAVQTFFDSSFSAGPGGLYPGYIPSTGAVASTSDDRYIGNNAFVLLALNHFQARTMGTSYQNRYKSMADSIAAWMVTLQDIPGQQNHYNDGGFYAGYRGATSSYAPGPGGVMNYKVNEGTIDAIAALRGHALYYGGSYASNAASAETFLFTTGNTGNNAGGLWNPTYHRFYGGKTDSGSYPSGSPTWDGSEYLDNVLWSLLMVNDDTNWQTLQPAIATTTGDMYVTGIHPDINPSLSLSGFTDVQGTNHIFTEGYAYMALVDMKRYWQEVNKNGYSSTAASYLSDRTTQLNGYVSLTIPSQVVSGTSGSVQKSSIPSYTGETTSLGSESVLWYLMAAYNLNPFDPSQLIAAPLTDYSTEFSPPTAFSNVGGTVSGLTTFDAGIAIASGATLPSPDMGLDAPFGPLRLYNSTTAQPDIQIVSATGDIHLFANGNDVADITPSGVTLGSGGLSVPFGGAMGGTAGIDGAFNVLRVANIDTTNSNVQLVSAHGQIDVYAGGNDIATFASTGMTMNSTYKLSTSAFAFTVGAAAGKVLTSDASGNASWGATSGAPLTDAATQTSGFTASSGTFYPVNATSGASTVTLPTSTGSTALLGVKKTDASGNAVTISGTINGSNTTMPLSLQNQSQLFIADGSGGWNTFGGDKTLASLDSRYVLSSTLPLSISSGGTGSASQNFVDLSTVQTIGGAKTFSSAITGSQGFAVAANAALSSGMGLDAPFGTAALRFINNNTSGNIQLVAPNGAVNMYVGGNDIMDVTTTGVTLYDTYNLTLGTTTGTKIGTATSQKIGFYNTTPVVQPNTVGTTTGFTASTGTTVLSGSTFTGNTGSTAYTIGDIVNALKALGLLSA